MIFDESQDEETIQLDFSEDASEVAGSEDATIVSENSHIDEVRSDNNDSPVNSKREESSKQALIKKSILYIFTSLALFLGIIFYFDEDRILINQLESTIQDLGLYSFEDVDSDSGSDQNFQQQENYFQISNQTIKSKKIQKSKDKKNTDIKDKKGIVANEDSQVARQEKKAVQRFINAYWPIPLPSAPRMSQKLMDWDRDTEIRWTNMMNHSAIWQRYLILDEIDNNPKIGVEGLLFESFGKNKLWLNLKILGVLAEYGVVLSKTKISQALNKERDSLLSNYFKRFRTHESARNIFVMLQVLPICSEMSRMTILKNLNFYGMDYYLIYFIAALSDESKKIRDFSRKILSERGFKYFQIESVKNTYFKILSAEISFDEGAKVIEQTINLVSDI